MPWWSVVFRCAQPLQLPPASQTPHSSNAAQLTALEEQALNPEACQQHLSWACQSSHPGHKHGTLDQYGTRVAGQIKHSSEPSCPVTVQTSGSLSPETISGYTTEVQINKLSPGRSSCDPGSLGHRGASPRTEWERATSGTSSRCLLGSAARGGSRDWRGLPMEAACRVWTFTAIARFEWQFGPLCRGHLQLSCPHPITRLLFLSAPCVRKETGSLR